MRFSSQCRKHITLQDWMWLRIRFYTSYMHLSVNVKHWSRICPCICVVVCFCTKWLIVCLLTLLAGMLWSAICARRPVVMSSLSPVAITFCWLLSLSKPWWCIQTDQRRPLGSRCMCTVDSRSWLCKPRVSWAGRWTGENSAGSPTSDVLRVPAPLCWCLHSVPSNQLLHCISRYLRTAGRSPHEDDTCTTEQWGHQWQWFCGSCAQDCLLWCSHTGIVRRWKFNSCRSEGAAERQDAAGSENSCGATPCCARHFYSCDTWAQVTSGSMNL